MTRKLILAAFALLSLVASLTGATQYIAYQLGYSSILGDPIGQFGAHSVYWPWMYCVWLLEISEAYPDPFSMAFLFMLPGGVGCGVVGLIAQLTKKQTVKEFGRDAWATKKDLKTAGLLDGGQPAVVCGIEDGKLLTYSGPEHHLITGATRSGKGRGHVVPTLLHYTGSAVIHDIKGELWRGDMNHGFHGTAGWRSQFGYVLRFNPTSLDSARFNPLEEVRKGPETEFRDVANIVEIIADPTGEKTNPDFFDNAAKSFLNGLLLHVLYAAPDDRKNLAEARRLLADPDETAAEMMATFHRRDEAGKPEVHPAAAHAGQALLNMSDRTRASVIASAETFFAVWGDEVVAHNTASSTFRIGDLMCRDAPVSLYIQPPPSDEKRVRPLTRLLLNQIGRGLMEQQEFDTRGRRKQWPLLFLLDEFAQLGRLPFWLDNMSKMAGYGLKSYLVCQGFTQIDDTYGPHNSVLDNCHIVVGYPSLDDRSASKLSRMLGGHTELREIESRSGSRFSLMTTHKRIDVREENRPLVQPNEIRQTHPDIQYLVVGGMAPYRGQKLKYDQHKLFRSRNIPAPASSHVLASEHDWIGVAPVSAPARGSATRGSTGGETAEKEVHIEPLDADLKDVREGGQGDRAEEGQTPQEIADPDDTAHTPEKARAAESAEKARPEPEPKRPMSEYEL